MVSAELTLRLMALSGENAPQVAKAEIIVITHNPTTMEAAPVWYGVTMTQPGISRVLGMQVPQAN